ncbi:YncE family protein [candidate division WOR-3 bacterium]|nr:YncE family protein [candidate division WOR-3 bacterium]
MPNRFALVLAALCAAAPAQFLETTIVLPDSSYPYGLCYNPVNDKVYCANMDGNTVTIIDGATNSIIRTLPAGLGPVDCRHNPVNNLVYCECYGSAELVAIDGATDSVVAVVPGVGSSWEVCWNSVNNTIFTSYTHWWSGVVVTSCATNLPFDTVVTEPYPFRLCHNPTANKVYCGVSDSLVAVIDGQTNALIEYVRVGAAPQGLLFIPGRNKVYCANQGNDFSVIDGATNRVTTIRVEGILNTAVYNGREDRVYAAVVDRDSIVVVDCATDSVVAMVPAGDNPLGICYAPGGNKVYCSNHVDRSVTVLDCATNSVVATVGVGDYPWAVCDNPRRNRVYVANTTSSTISVIRDTTAGVEESAEGEGARLEPGMPTVVRGTLFWSAATPSLRSVGDLALHATDGRRVMGLAPGPNDVSRLAPGVYFVREAQAAAAHRVVIAR